MGHQCLLRQDLMQHCSEFLVGRAPVVGVVEVFSHRAKERLLIRASYLNSAKQRRDSTRLR